MDKVNILLVDDQPGKLLSYQAILADLGENLLLAQSGREALQTLLREECALILLDVVMPEMDGFEIAAMIRERPRLERTPIIFVKSYSTSDMDRLRGYELGAVDYVFAPIVPEILRAKVAAFVELYRIRRELAQANSNLRAEIAERVRVEEQLRQTEQRLRLMVEGVKDYAIVMIDPEGGIATWNSGAERIYGYRADEIIGQHFSRFYAQVDKDCARLEHADRLSAGPIGIDNRGNLAVGADLDESWRELLALGDVDRLHGIGEAHLFQGHTDLAAVRRVPGVEFDAHCDRPFSL